MLRIDVKKKFVKKGKEEFSLDVNFTANAGITVLAGPSGAGKTTTLRLIAGILLPDSGTIALGSEVFYDSDERINVPIQKRSVGFVFQDYALFPHLTAGQNIAFGAKIPERSAKQEKAREMLELFRIEHLENRIPAEMSGGEQQRTALARALASEPKIVLLDEPLSAVDVETRAKLLDEIELAQSRADIPFIYVTHNEEEATRLAAGRITLANGRIDRTTESEIQESLV
ncbi:MAG: ATP-binding cassette domain-containing protein [Acidobacteria bacterium]|nr:ATP-binding cassette domain-containing protein [Acidobacteriota bacterium]